MENEEARDQLQDSLNDLDDNDNHEPLVNQDERPAEGDHLDGPHQELQPDRQGKIFCAKKGFFVTCFIIAVLIIIALFAIGITLLAITRPSHMSTTILRQGAYVKLEFDSNINHNFFSKLSVSVDNRNAVVNLYKVKCNELSRYVEPAESTLYQVSDMQYFAKCSIWPGKCPIEEYLYLVKADYAVINITISVRPFEKGEKIRFLVYDDHAKFQKFLESDGPSEALFKPNIRTNVTSVTFGDNDMIKIQSYYFFAIEEYVRNDTLPSEWFIVNHTSTVIASYSGLKGFAPNCTLSPRSNEQVSCLIELSSVIDSQCVVGHYMQDGANDLAVEAKVELIPTDSAETAKTIGIIFISVTSAIILVALLALCVYCYIKIH